MAGPDKVGRGPRGAAGSSATVSPPLDRNAAKGSEARPRPRTIVGQDRAGHAWAMVRAASGQVDRYRYTTLVRKLPSYLQSSGLGQTFAFLHDRGQEQKNGQKPPEGLLLQQLGEHLARHLGRAPQLRPMELILALEPVEYRRATQELMLLAEWLKRFAVGVG